MWTMWAHKSLRKPSSFRDIHETKRFVEMCGGRDLLVQVLVKESDTGNYFGWIDKGESVPCMIWPSKIQLNMCFGEGISNAIKNGKGKPVQLEITEIL